MYQIGSKVECAWPDGSMLIGTLITGTNGGLDISYAGGLSMVFTLDAQGSLRGKFREANIVVLAAPRPDAPTTVGAMVEAGHAQVNRRRLFCLTGGGEWRLIGTRNLLAPWGELLDPVVRFAG